MSEVNQTGEETLSLSDHELLLRLAQQQKTAMWHRRIIAYVEVLILVLLIAVILVIGPKMIRLTSDMADTLERVNTLVDEAEPAIEGFSSLDYETLNESIGTLSESVNQFSEFMGRFSSFGSLFR
ncbi:MAG: hypothetical protein IJ225_09425 [Solobacterium sp.]|nr:hypothetical protein [Solobacterium sp.]